MHYRFDFAALEEYWPDFLSGALTTLQMTAVATVLGVPLGSTPALILLWTVRAAWVALVIAYLVIAGRRPTTEDKARLDQYFTGLRDLERQFDQQLTSLGVVHQMIQFNGFHNSDYWSAHVGQYLLWYSASLAAPQG